MVEHLTHLGPSCAESQVGKRHRRDDFGVGTSHVTRTYQRRRLYDDGVGPTHETHA
jgi:hypothetical protein